MLNVIMLSVANKPLMLNVIMLNVVKLSVIMLNVVAPYKYASLLCPKQQVQNLGTLYSTLYFLRN